MESLESRLLLTVAPLVGQVRPLSALIVPELTAEVTVLPLAAVPKTSLAGGSINSSRAVNAPVAGLVSGSATETTSPVITLRYEGIQSSARQTLVSTPVVSNPLQVLPTKESDQASMSPEDAELTSNGIEKLPTIPVTGDITVSGSLAPQQTWSTYKIPVDPATQSLQVAVSHDPTIQTPTVPALDQLYLVGPTGTVLAKLTGASENFQGAEQDVSVGLSRVPTGSSLVVRIIETPVSTAPSQTSPSSGSTSSMPFTMEVTRPQLMDGSIVSVGLGPGSAGSPESSLAIGFAPIFLDVAQPGPSDPGVSTAEQTTASGLPGNLTGKSPVAPPAAQPVPTEESLLTVPGVSVGPLVSRGSAPLGPSLGTIPGDPIPALDRNERAFDLSWFGSGKSIAGDSEYLSGRLSRLGKGNSEGTVNRQTGGAYGDGEEFVSQRGPGGFPALSTNVKGDRTDGDPEMILATIASLAAPEGSGEMIAGTFVRSTDEISRLDPRLSSHFVHADFFTAACSLAVGISLTAGPLYPDLMISIRAWLPGLWPQRIRTSSPRLPKRRFSLRSPRSWFRLLRRAATAPDADRSP